MLTKNFSLEELTRSETAERRGIDNTPGAVEKANLEKLAKLVLQPIRDKLGSPITVTSGYRCKKLNNAVGGSLTSQHLTGEAADLKSSWTTNAKLFETIREMIKNNEIKVGQLIWERGTDREPAWVHVSLPYTKTNQILKLL